jgi:hypothetical protein
MFDAGAWLAGLSTPVTVGWGVWVAWSLALAGWYRYALVAPKVHSQPAAPRPPFVAARPVEEAPMSFEQPESFGHEAPDASMDLGLPPAQIDWSTAETAPAMRAPRRRPVEAAPAPEVPAEAPPRAASPAGAAYQFTTHRQDEIGVSQH